MNACVYVCVSVCKYAHVSTADRCNCRECVCVSVCVCVCVGVCVCMYVCVFVFKCVQICTAY